jgi:hypothetical protein
MSLKSINHCSDLFVKRCVGRGQAVGKENIQENSWNNADVQTTDVLTREPLEKKTYAAVVRRNTYCVRFNDRSERMQV